MRKRLKGKSNSKKNREKKKARYSTHLNLLSKLVKLSPLSLFLSYASPSSSLPFIFFPVITFLNFLCSIFVSVTTPPETPPQNRLVISALFLCLSLLFSIPYVHLLSFPLVSSSFPLLNHLSVSVSSYSSPK